MSGVAVDPTVSVDPRRATPSVKNSISLLNQAKAVVAVLVLIFIIWKWRAFSSSGVGGAISKILGTAGAFVTWVAGFPSWLLIGLGAAFLFGPAILKMSSAAAKLFGARAKSLQKAIDKSETLSDEVERAAAERIGAHELVEQGYKDSRAEMGNNPDLDKAEARAEVARAEAMSEYEAAGGRVLEAAFEGKELAEEVVENEGRIEVLDV